MTLMVTKHFGSRVKTHVLLKQTIPKDEKMIHWRTVAQRVYFLVVCTWWSFLTHRHICGDSVGSI